MYHFFRLIVLAFSLLLLCQNVTLSQDPLRFESEVQALLEKDSARNTAGAIVFTGSSSVRFWPELESIFEPAKVLNRGFGGSTTSDLIYYADQLILKHHPSKIFIYEGDNDVSFGMSSDNILFDTKVLLAHIRASLPDVPIYIISPKPSVARWELKVQYLSVNQKLKEICSQRQNLVYIDVWTPMCDEAGEVLTDIFISDNLHMNSKGYAIWNKVVGPYVNE